MTSGTEYLLLNERKFFLDAIKSNEYSAKELTDFEITTLNFCRDWLNKKQKFILHSSGSTGKPKPIELSAKQMKMSAEMTIEALNLSKNNTILVCLNTAYIAGVMMLVRGLEGNMQMVIQNPSANPVADLKDDISIDFTALVPYQLQNIIEDPFTAQKFSTFKKAIIGGAPISQLLDSQVQRCDVALYQTYGMTETVSHIALRKINGTEKSPYYNTLGSTKIDQDSRGCLKICSPITHNEWLTTNDIVEIIDHNKFLWKGRIDHVINSGGFKFQIEELESDVGNVLLTEGIKSRFFISGIPHPSLGERVALILEGEPSEELSANLLNRFSQEKERYKYPRALFFIPLFKETPTGKILRKENLSSLNLI